jgi:dihydroorotase-like cyclic amidohydrolase
MTQGTIRVRTIFVLRAQDEQLGAGEFRAYDHEATAKEEAGQLERVTSCAWSVIALPLYLVQQQRRKHV